MAQNIVKRRIVEGALKGDVRFRSQSPNLRELRECMNVFIISVPEFEEPGGTPLPRIRRSTPMGTWGPFS